MSSSDDDANAILGLLVVLEANKKRRKKRNCWSKKWLMKRETYSHINLLNELKVTPKDWHNYLRMDESTYLNLLSVVTPLIEKKNTVMRSAISPHERLTATLRFLATGRSFEDLKYSTIISPQALGKIIPETCEAIYSVLHKDHLKVREIVYNGTIFYCMFCISQLTMDTTKKILQIKILKAHMNTN